jgi:hypothetical protein
MRGKAAHCTRRFGLTSRLALWYGSVWNDAACGRFGETTARQGCRAPTTGAGVENGGSTLRSPTEERCTHMRNTILILGLAAVVLFLAGVAVVLVWRPWANEAEAYVAEPGYYQRTIGRGNLPRNELVAEEGDWVYCFSRYGFGNIYKVHKSGSPKELFVSHERGVGTGLQIWDGWLYYGHFSEGCISRIRLDGTKQENLTVDTPYKSIFNTYPNSNISIVDGHLYATDTAFNEEGLYKMDLDGNNMQKLINKPIWSYLIYDDWVFYVYDTIGDRTDVEPGIYKMKLNGAEWQKIFDENAGRFSVMDGWLYFINQDNGYLYRISLDGSDQTTVIPQKVMAFIVVDDWIYYSIYSDKEEYGIYRIKTDSSEPELVLNEPWIISVEYAAGWLYYRQELDKNQSSPELYRVRTDGTGKEKATV